MKTKTNLCLTRWVLLSALAALALLSLRAAMGQERGQTVRPANSKRIALVIGNGKYDGAPLANPANDAREMAKALRDLGFEVIELTDQTKSQMRQALRAFGDKLDSGEGNVGLFFFAGHGAQVNGKNFLIPIGVDVANEAEAEDECVNVELALAQMKRSRNGLNIVILDACRNNPFRGWRSGEGGLAFVNAPRGTLIAYATAPGRTAADGRGKNSPYTIALLKHIGTPGINLLKMFEMVRAEVESTTGYSQTPWESTSVTSGSEFYLAGKEDRPSPPSRPSVSDASPVRPTTLAPVIPLPRGVEPSRLAVHNFTTASVDAKGNVRKFSGAPTQQYSEDLGDGVSLEMVAVKGGPFTMGSDSYEDEKPLHQATVGDFWIGKFEVTQGQWKAVMGNDKNPSRFKGDDLPVESVSWEEVKEFCRRLNAKLVLSEAEGYRLPSEAEWEYAVRAGSKTDFAFGETITPEVVNYDGNYPYSGAPIGTYRQKTIAVGSLGVANAWGLFDLHGNVWEWCEDDWHGNYNGAPTDGREWVDISGRASRRVIRGGGWNYYAVNCRSADRGDYSPDSRLDGIGFRLSRKANGDKHYIRPSSPYHTFNFTTAIVNATGHVVNRVTKQAEELSVDLGDGVTLELVRIPAGKFLMGSPANEKGRDSDEGPQRQVNVGEFLMGKYEVTREQWRAVARWPKVKIDLPEDPSYFKDDWKQPVEQVSWDEATEFCARLTRKFGVTYRLPSEAEWEYAARAGTTTRYAFGNEWSSEVINDGSETVVGSYPANGWGLFDMHGSVFEWCEDDYHSNYQGAPNDGKAWVDISSRASTRVIRGGGRGFIDTNCRSANRGYDKPDTRHLYFGFRLSRAVR